MAADIANVLDETARPLGRAVLLWRILLSAASALAIAETNGVATYVAAFLLVLSPGAKSLAYRAISIVGAVTTIGAGSPSLLIWVPTLLWLDGASLTAAVAVMGMYAVSVLCPFLQTFSDSRLLVLPAATASPIIVATIVATLVGVSCGAVRGTLAAIVASAAVFVALELTVLGGWFTAKELTNPFLRVALALAPAAAFQFFPATEVLSPQPAAWTWLLAVLSGAVLPLSFAHRPVTTVIFDEAHGKWETALSPYGPNDFGRAVTYTYSLLYRYADRVVGRASAHLADDVLPASTDALFVLKMPTDPLDTDFANRLDRWVRSGGRLLVVADHTDLYDTAQNLNPFLRRFGFSIRTDAVFDALGHPNEPRTSSSAILLGRINANGKPFPWQTGASVATLPIGSLALATYGLGFSEPGDYSRPNRFGPFRPRPTLRYGEQGAVYGLAVGKGAVAVVLDSTPWSTFSFHKSQYPYLFRGLLHALAEPMAIRMVGFGAPALLPLAVVIAVARHPAFLAIGGLIFGVTISSAVRVGVGSIEGEAGTQNCDVGVGVGRRGGLQFLKQRVEPGQHNFSRILSAIAKYDVFACVGEPGERVDWKASRRWILVQPDIDQLPRPELVFELLESGGFATVLLDREAAADSEIREWLESIGLHMVRRSAFAVAEGDLARHSNAPRHAEPLALRDIRTVTIAPDTSLLVPMATNALLQTYVLRTGSTGLSRGSLSVGFAADQFSDDAVGEVWDGVHPGSLGRLREEQLAAALGTTEQPPNFPRELFREDACLSEPARGRYTVLRDGQTIMEGRFGEVPVLGGGERLGDLAYLADLRARALRLVDRSCPQKAEVTECSARLLGPELREWMIYWRAGGEGHPVSIELVHDRRFSGSGATWNVVLAE